MYDMGLETDLEAFIHDPHPLLWQVAGLARRFLVEQGEPTDIPHTVMVMKALETLREQERAQGH